jgi:phosphohistidine phosphatase
VNLYLVHHAEALSATVDPLQPLSEAGRKHAESLAVRAKARGIQPVAIWHSGKLRARQTAEAMLAVVNPFAACRMVRGLQPEDRPGTVAGDIEDVESDLMIVSHAPLLSALLEQLGVQTSFPLHGMVALSRVDPGRYLENWKME